MPVPKAAKVKGSSTLIGVNLASSDDWSASYPFVDVFGQSRAWISGTRVQFDDARPLDLDERRLGQVAEGLAEPTTIIFPSVPKDPKGNYTMLDDGTGNETISSQRLAPPASPPSLGRAPH